MQPLNKLSMKKVIPVKRPLKPRVYVRFKRYPKWLAGIKGHAHAKAILKLERRASRKIKASRSTGSQHSEVSHARPYVKRRTKHKYNPKNLNPVNVKGNRVLTDVYGLPSARYEDTTNQLLNDTVYWLKSWSTTNGNHKAPNPHAFQKVEARYYHGIVRSQDKYGNYSEAKGSQVAGYYPSQAPLQFDASTYNTALGRLYDKLRGEVDLSIDLAEVHKTKAMMSKTLRGIASLAKTFRKMRRSNPRDWGNIWLEWTYGWKPLASSIYGAAHELIVGPRGPRFLAVEGSAKHDYDTRSSTGDGTSVVRENLLVNRAFRCKIRAKYSFTESALDTLAGFTSLNPVSIAWELTPYSFVVDWFLDIGGYLRNFETACLYGTDFVSGYVSEGWRISTHGTRYLQTVPVGLAGTFSFERSDSYVEEVGFRRLLLGGTPFPRAPRFDPKLGSSRLISGAALLGQLLPGRKH